MCPTIAKPTSPFKIGQTLEQQKLAINGRKPRRISDINLWPVYEIYGRSMSINIIKFNTCCCRYNMYY